LIASATDRTAAIANAAFEEHNPSQLCTETVDTFVSILASEAANMALKVIATGGIYLAGGIPLHILRAAEESRFIETLSGRDALFTSWNEFQSTSYSIALRWLGLPQMVWRVLQRNHKADPYGTRVGYLARHGVHGKDYLTRGQLGAQLGGSYAVRDNFAFTFGVLAGRFPASPRARFHLGFGYDFK